MLFFLKKDEPRSNAVGTAVSYFWTVRFTFVRFVFPPPVPVTVSPKVPGLACVMVMNFNVEVCVPEMDAGLKVAVTPAGRPVTDKAMEELKLPVSVALMVVVTLSPSTTETEAGVADSVKLPGTAVTVSETVDFCVIPPPVPVTVIVYVPADAVAATEMFIVELPDPGAAIDVGLKVTVTPVGWPVADHPTDELKPPVTALVTVDEPVLPCCTETEVGEVEMVKFAGVLVDASALRRPVPLGLPQPVTRS